MDERELAEAIARKRARFGVPTKETERAWREAFPYAEDVCGGMIPEGVCGLPYGHPGDCGEATEA
jgi:hypothetical protein